MKIIRDSLQSSAQRAEVMKNENLMQLMGKMKWNSVLRLWASLKWFMSHIVVAQSDNWMDEIRCRPTALMRSTAQSRQNKSFIFVCLTLLVIPFFFVSQQHCALISINLNNGRFTQHNRLLIWWERCMAASVESFIACARNQTQHTTGRRRLLDEFHSSSFFSSFFSLAYCWADSRVVVDDNDKIVVECAHSFSSQNRAARWCVHIHEAAARSHLINYDYCSNELLWLRMHAESSIASAWYFHYSFFVFISCVLGRAHADWANNEMDTRKRPGKRRVWVRPAAEKKQRSNFRLSSVSVAMKWWSTYQTVFQIYHTQIHDAHKNIKKFIHWILHFSRSSLSFEAASALVFQNSLFYDCLMALMKIFLSFSCHIDLHAVLVHTYGESYSWFSVFCFA